MSAAYRLPDRPAQDYLDESLAGLAMRCASLYGFAVPEQLFARIGEKRRYLPTWAALDPASPQGEAMLALLDVGPERASRLSNWHPDPSSVRVLGARVDLDLADLWTRQVCPGCLREAAYHRAEWLVSAMPACARHRAMLLRDCPGCGKRLAWRGKGVGFCGNPACSLDLAVVRAKPLAAGEDAGLAGLHGLLHGGAGPGGMEFGDALRAALTLGSFALGLPRWHRPSGFVERRRGELPRILGAGWRALEPWPAGYRGLLDRLASEAGSRRARRGLARAYGPLADLLGRNAATGWAAPLVSAMADHAIGRADVGLRPDVARRHSSGRLEAERHLSLNEAARMLGVSVDTVSRLARRAGLDASAVPGGAQRMLRQDEVRRLADVRRRGPDAITARDAAALLGVSAPTLRAMVSSGTLRSIPARDRVKARLSFARAEVDSLLAAFARAASGAPVVDAPGPEHRVPGGGGTKDGFGIRRIVSAVLAGELSPVAVCKSGTGLQRYMFPRLMPPADAPDPAPACGEPRASRSGA